MRKYIDEKNIKIFFFLFSLKRDKKFEKIFFNNLFFFSLTILSTTKQDKKFTIFFNLLFSLYLSMIKLGKY